MGDMGPIGINYAILYRTVREELPEEVAFDWRKPIGSERLSC